MCSMYMVHWYIVPCTIKHISGKNKWEKNNKISHIVQCKLLYALKNVSNICEYKCPISSAPRRNPFHYRPLKVCTVHILSPLLCTSTARECEKWNEMKCDKNTNLSNGFIEHKRDMALYAELSYNVKLLGNSQWCFYTG